MTSPQSQVSGGGKRDDFDAEDAGFSTASVQNTGVDDLLDEIDGLLENNAEEFVRSYVQKGGQ